MRSNCMRLFPPSVPTREIDVAVRGSTLRYRRSERTHLISETLQDTHIMTDLLLYLGFKCRMALWI